jgi:hypothetical protein
VSRSLLGRALAIAGIVCGLLAVGLQYVSGYRYLDDGTTVVYLVVLLSLASWLPAEIGRDLFGAAAGAASFGLLLFVPASAAFDNLGRLEAGAWLGLCTLLVPIGAVLSGEVAAAPRAPARPAGLGLTVVASGLVLLVAGTWLDAAKHGPSYWNLSSSGHAIGILLLLLAALNAVFVLGPAIGVLPALGDLDLLVAAATFGLVEAGLVSTAFEDFGTLGAGGWLEAGAGVLLLGGVAWLRSAASIRTEAAASLPSPAR